jgi:putative glutamine amidotransferase
MLGQEQAMGIRPSCLERASLFGWQSFGMNHRAWHRPTIAITSDIEYKDDNPRAATRFTYIEGIVRAGGVPVLLPAVPELAESHAMLVDGYVFIGGDDLRQEPFGGVTHPKAEVLNPQRQAYETALLKALRDRRAAAPVLGVCLGMQHMSMLAGGTMDQYLPETLPTAERHRFDHQHAIVPNEQAAAYAIVAGMVTSYHKQGVIDVGSLTVLARSDDGVIEAVADVNRPFYLGVQWHPERTSDSRLGQGMFEELVRRCR